MRLRTGLLKSATAVSFSPSQLFTAGEAGVWYDPSDLTTLFQDTAGTTPVTTPGQTVALMLDKSRVQSFGGPRRNGLVQSNSFSSSPLLKLICGHW